MPFKSAKQRRFIYSQAGKGKKWAKRFISHTKRAKKRK